MTKNTLLSTIAALTLFGATGIATAQSPGGNAVSAPPAAAAPKEEMSKPPAAKPGPSAEDSKSAPKQAQISNRRRSRLRTQNQPLNRLKTSPLQLMIRPRRSPVAITKPAPLGPRRLEPQQRLLLKSAVKSRRRSSRRR